MLAQVKMKPTPIFSDQTYLLLKQQQVLLLPILIPALSQKISLLVLSAKLMTLVKNSIFFHQLRAMTKIWLWNLLMKKNLQQLVVENQKKIGLWRANHMVSWWITSLPIMKKKNFYPTHLGFVQKGLNNFCFLLIGNLILIVLITTAVNFTCVALIYLCKTLLSRCDEEEIPICYYCKMK